MTELDIVKGDLVDNFCLLLTPKYLIFLKNSDFFFYRAVRITVDPYAAGSPGSVPGTGHPGAPGGG